MARKPIAIIESVQRKTRDGKLEELKFTGGLNLLVGMPNAGKSTWLGMLDYALGKAGNPESAFGPDVAEKYGQVGVTLRIGTTVLQVLRVWDDSGPKSKTQLNGEWLTASELSDALMMAFEYPLVRFPQGNPYSDRTWPSLTFRTALRHLYRAETDWADLAPRQPDNDQHAVIALFLGVAEELFPEQYGLMVDAQKRLNQLEAERSAYERVVSDVVRQILNAPGLSVGITPQSTELSQQTLSLELAQLEASRLEALSGPDRDNREYLANQAEAQAVLAKRLDVLAKQKEDAHMRLADLAQYEKNARSETSRLRRAQVAGRTLGRFPTTVCPACLKPVKPAREDSCSLCGAPKLKPSDEKEADSRIQFELDQLEEELREVKHLFSTLEGELAALNERQELLKAELSRMTDEASRAVIPSKRPSRDAKIAGIDVGIGRTQEKMEQLDRVQKLLKTRDEYSSKADHIQEEIQALRETLKEVRISSDLNLRSDLLADGMNDFLNLLNIERPGAWPESAVSFRLKEREFSLKVGDREWRSALGATLRLYLLFAYQYGLMALVGKPETSSPGFCILDLPPSLAEGPDITEYGDYAIRPFKPLIERSGQQLIVSGREFPTIASAHRIELPDQWRV